MNLYSRNINSISFSLQSLHRRDVLWTLQSTFQTPKRSLMTKRKHPAPLLLQSDALKEIAAATGESNDKNGATQEII